MAAVTGPPLQAADQEMTPAQAAAAGLGWVDRNHPLYGTPGFVGSGSSGAGQAAPAGAGQAAPAGAGGTASPTGQQAVARQAGAAQTYSTTPGAPPSETTTNQGTQDVVRNSYLQRATAPISDPRADPTFRLQADTYAAGAERARRDQVADSAEAFAGTGQVGAQNAETRLINERAAQARGSFEADLVRQDLTRQREDVQQALSQLSGMISADQTRQLQDKLAQLDAQLKQAGLNASTSLGSQELGLRERLGMGGLNLDLLRTILQNQQFGQSLGFNIGDREAYWNQVALDRILGS